MKMLVRWDGSEDTRRLAQYLEVKVTYHSEQCAIEVQDKSLKNDGSLSWLVVSRGTNTYVEELYEEKGESVYDKEMATGFRARRNPSRRNTRDNQVHNRIPSPRCSYQLTNGSLEDSDGDITTSFFSPRRWWSDGLGLRMRERREMDGSGMAGSFSKKKWQEKISALPEFRRSHSLDACHPRSLWRSQGWSHIAGQCRHSVQMERVPLPRWLCPLHALHDSIRIDCRRKRCKSRKKNSIVHRPGSHEGWARGRAPGLVETTNGTSQEQVENNPGCNTLG